MPTSKFASLLSVGVALSSLGAAHALQAPHGVPVGRAARLLESLPLAFVENQGQWPESVRFVARRGDFSALFCDDAAYLRVRNTQDSCGPEQLTLRLSLADRNGLGTPSAENVLPGRYHFLSGTDPASWKRDVSAFGAVRYANAAPGVELLFHEGGTRVKYDVVLDAGTAVDGVALRVEGADALEVAADGALIWHTAVGEIRQPAPVAWYTDADGRPCEVPCRFAITGRDTFGFEVDGRPLDRPLTIDPGLEYSTFLGGVAVDMATAMVMSANGVVTVAGWTGGAFPVTAGAFDTSHSLNWNEAFVTRLSADGSALVWSTYLGEGSGDSYATDIAAAADDSVVLVGSTMATAFPTTAGAFDTSFNGGSLGTGDAFVSHLSSDGSTLLASTYLGAASDDRATALVIERVTGDVIVAGQTFSSGFPVTVGAFDTVFSGTGTFGRDGFVARFNSSLSTLGAATFLGGSSNEEVSDLALRSEGQIVAAGITDSTNFPTSVGAFDSTANGNDDNFVSILNSSLSTLVASTYLGGDEQEMAPSLAPQAQRSITVVGTTGSASFPTTAGAFDTTFNGGMLPFSFDGYVTRFATGLNTLTFSTFLGGSAHFDIPVAVAVDSAGRTVVVGDTGSSDFPTTAGAFDTSFNGGDANFFADAFVTRLNASGSGLIYSTFIGDDMGDGARDVVLDGAARATYVGTSQSLNYPTTAGAFQTTHGGSGPAPFDAVVTRLDLLPTGVDEYGFSTPACNGAIAIGVNKLPLAGSATFAIDCIGAPPSASGLLILGVAADPVGTPVAGVTVFVDLTQPYTQTAVTSDSAGFASTSNLITTLSAGTTFYAQYYWFNPAGCGPGVRSGSNALEVIVQ